MQTKHFLLFLAITVIAGCSSTAAPESAPAKSSEPAPMASATTADETIIIDVRSKVEWDTGHVKQATNIPHTEIGDRIAEVTSDKDAKILVYCKVGGRAGMAKSTLEEMGFTNVENVGGFDDIKDQYETE